MTYENDPLFKQFLAEEQAKQSPQQTNTKAQSFEKDPMFQDFYAQEKNLEKNYTPQEQQKIKSKPFDTGSDTVNDFLLGAGKNGLDYGASLIKLIGKAGGAMGFDDLKRRAKVAQKKLRVGSERADYNIGNKYVGMAGEMLADPLNLAPAGVFTKGAKAVRIVKSIAGGAGVGAGTMLAKDYGNDTLTQNEKNKEMTIGASFVAGINGIIAGLTKGRVTNAINADLFANKNPKEISDAILSNPEGFGLSKKEANDAVQHIQATYPKVPDEFKVEQAGQQPKPKEPNFIQVPKYPPMSKEQALSILAREADKKRIEQGLQPIYSVNPKYAKESVYPPQPKGTSQPNFVSGDFNNNIPVPYSEAQNLEARYQKIASHPRLQELLNMRENILAKDSINPTRNIDNGYFSHENNGNGWETTKIAPNRERNYNADFHLTKNDIYKLYTGKVDDDLLTKLETDLDTLDNHPDYAKSFNSDEPKIDYSQYQDPQYKKEPKDDTLKLYHGTDADFDNFEKMGDKITSIGRGHYFSPDKEIASQYGKNIKELEIKKSDLLDLDNPTSKQKQEIVKLLNEVVPENIRAGYGGIKRIDVTDMPADEATKLFMQKKKDTENFWHDRAKAKIVEDGDKYYIQWQEPGLENASNANLKNLIQEYRQTIPKEMGYKSARNGQEVAIYDTDFTNELLHNYSKPTKMSDADWEEANRLFANGGKHLAVGVANGTNEAYNTDGTLEDKEKAFIKGLFAGMIGSKISVTALKKLNPKLYEKASALFQDEVKNGKVGMFVGSKPNEMGAFSDVATKKAMREIDDSGAKFNPIPKQKVKFNGIEYEQNYAKLGEIINHPKLFKKYPHLKDITVSISDKPGKEASYNNAIKSIALNRGNTNKIEDESTRRIRKQIRELDKNPIDNEYKKLNDKFIDEKTNPDDLMSIDEQIQNTPTGKKLTMLNTELFKAIDNANKNGARVLNEDGKKTLLHEIQHAIQSKEGWAKGGSPEDFKKEELLHKGINKELDKIDDALGYNKWFEDNIDTIAKELERKPNDQDIARKMFAKTLQPSTRKKYLNKLSEARQIQSKNKKMLGLKSNEYPDPTDAYKRLWGEQQARATQLRAKMTPEQRANESWTDTLKRVEGEYKEPIVRYDDNVAEMRPQKDLIIQHNLSEDNLHHADKHGGLAVPSLAITKKDTPLDGFGNITLLGDEALAKPKRDHKVYGADIYSPRYPKIKKDLKIADQRRIQKDLAPYNEALGKDADYIDFDNLSDSVAMKMKFLESKGIKPNLVNDMPNENEKAIYENFKDFLKDGIKNRDYLKNNHFMEKVKDSLGIEDITESELSRYALELVRNLKITKSKLSKANTPDFYKSRSEISKQVDKFKDEYKNYVDNYLYENGAVDKIYNGTDSRGRQKWQIHTLDNVVKKLKKDLRGGENFNYGTGSMRAKFTPEFKTFQKIRDAKDKLVSHEEFDNAKKEVEDAYFSLQNEFAKYHKNGDSFDFENTFNGLIEDSISSPIEKELRDYGFKNVPKELISKLENFKDALREMPTEYFESKVLRAMDIGEFKHAVIPKDASQKTRDILEKKGIEVTEYDPTLPRDRIEKIKQTAEKNNYLFANAGHTMAGGFAGGADSLMNQRDYNGDGKYDYKDLLAGVATGAISINALKKLAPKLFDEGAETGGVKAGLFAGSKAKGFDAKAKAGKTFEGKYDTLDRFEIDDSKAVLDLKPIEVLNNNLNKKLENRIEKLYKRFTDGEFTEKEYTTLENEILNEMKTDKNGTFDLKRIFKHKELFDNYPKLSETKVTFTDMPKGASGYYDGGKNEIVLNSNLTKDEIKSSLLHELQHSIQRREGFARGGSAQEFYNDAKNKIDLLKYELEFEPDDFIKDKMMDKLQKLEDTYKTRGKEEAFDMYQRLAGEIEARDVQARADYTPQQREEIAPYSSENIAPEDAILKFNSSNSNGDLFKNMSESIEAFKEKIKKAKSKGYEHVINLVDKETRKDWGDATSWLMRNFTDTLGAEYHNLREDATSSTNGMSVKLERLHNVLKELNKTDRIAMHNYITGDEANIPKALKPLADNIKKSIDDMSKELIDLGVLSKEQYDEWAGHYIHRNYEKHFFQDIKGLMKRGFKIDEIQKRGKIEEISATQANKLLIDPSFIASTQKPLREGGQRLTKLPNGKYELRRDWSKEEREAMGEITDVSISAPETLMRLKRMVDNANFIKHIQGIDNVILKDAEKFSNDELSEQGFAKVPNNPKYGVLAGKVIRKDVLDDLSARNDELFNTFHGSDGAFGRIWKNYLSLWKKSKTVWNAPSHVNNFLSNLFLMHLAGMRADEIVTAVGRAGKMMVQGKKYEELLKKQMLGKATKSELAELAEMGEDLKYFIEAKESGLLGRSQLNDILQGSQKQVRTTTLGKIDKFTEDAYHNGDAINRIAMYAHLRSKLNMDADKARKAVLTIMPDYTKPMPKAYRYLRDSGVSPFISWSYYTMPAIYKMLRTKQGAKKATLAMGTLAGLEYVLTGGDITPMDNIPFINTNKPEDFKGRRFGVSSHNGNVTTVKTDRWIPYVELLSPVNFFISNVSGVTTNAIVNILTANSASGMINAYYGRPVTYKNKKASDKAYDYIKYLSKSYVPLPAQAYSGWDMIDSLARSKKKRKTNKVVVPRTTKQSVLQQLGLNSLTYSKSGLKKEQNE